MQTSNLANNSTSPSDSSLPENPGFQHPASMWLLCLRLCVSANGKKSVSCLIPWWLPPHQLSMIRFLIKEWNREKVRGHMQIKNQYSKTSIVDLGLIFQHLFERFAKWQRRCCLCMSWDFELNFASVCRGAQPWKPLDVMTCGTI